MSVVAHAQFHSTLTLGGDDNMEISSDAGHPAEDDDLIDIDIDFDEPDTKDEQMDDSEQANADDDLMYDEEDHAKNETANEEDMVDYVEDPDEELDDAQVEREQEQSQDVVDDLEGTDDQVINELPNSKAQDDRFEGPEDLTHQNREDVADPTSDGLDTAEVRDEVTTETAAIDTDDQRQSNTEHEGSLLQEEATQEQQQDIHPTVDETHTVSPQGTRVSGGEHLSEQNQDVSGAAAKSAPKITNTDLLAGPTTSNVGTSNHEQEAPFISFFWRDAVFNPFRPEDDTSPLVLKSSAAGDSLQTFLSACRQMLQGEIGEDCELELQFEQIDLCFRESDKDATPSLSDVNDIYVNLSPDDEPLHVALVERPSFTARWSELNDLVASGGTLRDANPNNYDVSGEYLGQTDKSAVTEESAALAVVSEDAAARAPAPPQDDGLTDNTDHELDEATVPAADDSRTAEQTRHDITAEHEQHVEEPEPDASKIPATTGKRDTAAYGQPNHEVEQVGQRQADGVSSFSKSELAHENDLDELDDEYGDNDDHTYYKIEAEAGEEVAVGDENPAENEVQQTLTGPDETANDEVRSNEVAHQHNDELAEPFDTPAGESGLHEPLPDQQEGDGQDEFFEPGANGDLHETEDSTEYFDASAGHNEDGNDHIQAQEQALSDTAIPMDGRPDIDRSGERSKDELPDDDQQDLFDDDEIHFELPKDEPTSDNEVSRNDHGTFEPDEGTGNEDGLQITEAVADPITASTSAQLQADESSPANGSSTNALATRLSRKRSFAEQLDDLHHDETDVKKSRSS